LKYDIIYIENKRGTNQMKAYSVMNPKIKFVGIDEEEILEKVKCYLLKEILDTAKGPRTQRVVVNNKLYKKNYNRYELHYTQYLTDGRAESHLVGMTICYSINEVRKKTFIAYKYNQETKEFEEEEE
jgi:hypothetical protein